MPFKIVTRGNLTKDYALYVLARNNKLIYFCNGSTRSIITLEGTAADIIKVEENICIGFNEGLIQIFSSSAVPLRSITTNDCIQGLANLYLERLSASKGIVVVGNGKLKLYDPSGSTQIYSSLTEVYSH